MRIALIGDSHMQALGPRLKALFRGEDVSIVANPGWSLARFLSEGNLPIAANYANLVVFEIGGNDALTDRMTAQTRLATALSLLRSGAANGARVVLVGPPTADRPDVDVRHQNATSNQASLWRSVGFDNFIDSRDVTAGAPMRDDDVHFTGAGYDAWARFLHGVLTGTSGAEGSAISVGLLALLGAGAAYFYFRKKR